MDEQTQMFISQCNICILASSMRVCHECAFKAGLDYWNCRCITDNIRHKSELFCVRCDTDRPSLNFVKLGGYIKVVPNKLEKITC